MNFGEGGSVIGRWNDVIDKDRFAIAAIVDVINLTGGVQYIKQKFIIVTRTLSVTRCKGTRHRQE